MKQRLLSVFAMLSLMISGVMAQTFTISTDCEGYFIAGDRVEVSIDIEGAQEMTALQFNFSFPEGFTLSEGWPIYMGNATNGHAMNASILDSGDLFVVLYSLHSGTFDDGTLISFNVTAAEDAVSAQGNLYNVRTATTDAVSRTLSDVTFAMNIASEEPEPTWHLSGPATEEEVTTQSYIDGLVYNQTSKPSTITLKKGYNVIIIPSSWTTPTFGLVSDFSKRYTPFTANDLGITNPSNKNVLVLYSEVENATCYVKWGTNVVPEPEPEPEPEGLSTSKYYRVKNVTTGLYLQVEGDNTNMKLQNKAEGLAMMQIFGLEDAAEGMYYIKAADADNRYYAHASGWNFNATTNADSKTPFTIALVEGEEGVYTLHQSVSEYQGLAGADNSEAGSPIYCNKGIDNNGKWAFEALTAEEQTAYVAALRPITSLDELSNSKAYYVKQPQRAGGTSWAVETGAEALKSNADLGIGASCKDNRQHFAFLTNNEGSTYYLYHVAEAKFVNKDGSLSENPADAVSFTDGKFENTFVVYFDTDHYINVGGSSQMVIDGWNTPDEGNSCELIPVADFDATEALKLIEALETGIESPVLDAQGSQLIYDLMGRRVEKAEKGIYIVDGKKVIVK